MALLFAAEVVRDLGEGVFEAFGLEVPSFNDGDPRSRVGLRSARVTGGGVQLLRERVA